METEFKMEEDVRELRGYEGGVLVSDDVSDPNHEAGGPIIARKRRRNSDVEKISIPFGFLEKSREKN